MISLDKDNTAIDLKTLNNEQINRVVITSNYQSLINIKSKNTIFHRNLHKGKYTYTNNFYNNDKILVDFETFKLIHL